jgi:hypothetical protein
MPREGFNGRVGPASGPGIVQTDEERSPIVRGRDRKTGGLGSWLKMMGPMCQPARNSSWLSSQAR